MKTYFFKLLEIVSLELKNYYISKVRINLFLENLKDGQIFGKVITKKFSLDLVKAKF